MSEPYYVTSIGESPNVQAVQVGTFYTIKSATSAQDACEQAAQIIAKSSASLSAIPPFLIAMPASQACPCTVSTAVSATASLMPAPAPPTGLSTSFQTLQGGGLFVGVTWNKVDDANTYVVSRSTTQGGPYTVVAEALNTPVFSDTDVTAGTTYYYVVQSLNIAGESSDSQEISATPVATS